MTQTLMFFQRRRYEQGDYPRNLYEIVLDFRDGIIRKPSFQREFCWSDDKQSAFVSRLVEYRKPIGVIALYELENDPDGFVWLNDGLQRLSTCKELLCNPSKFSLTEEQAIDILKGYQFAIQHRVYPDHDAAVNDYKDINKGTQLTSYEFYKGDLSNMTNFDSLWNSRLQALHDLIAQRLYRVSKEMKRDRNNEHKSLRHDFALFVRYCTSDKQNTNYQVNKPSPYEGRNKVLPVEVKLRKWLTDSGPQLYDQQLDKFLRIIDAETALVETEWEKHRESPGERIQPNLFRWLLDVAIWRRNNGKDSALWTDFLSKLLHETHGRQHIELSRGRYNPLTIGDLSRLKPVCDALGSKLYEETKKAATYKRPPNIENGYDISHVRPVSLWGDGPTVIEPSITNRARGAKPIDES